VSVSKPILLSGLLKVTYKIILKLLAVVTDNWCLVLVNSSPKKVLYCINRIGIR